MEEYLNQYPLWGLWTAVPICLVIGNLGVRIVRVTVVGVQDIIQGYPLSVLESEFPECRATWLTDGVMLTSRATGKAVSELPVSKVVHIMSNRREVLACLCMRFNARLKSAAIHQ